MIIIASGVHFIDITGAEALAGEAKALRKAGGALYLVGMRESVEQQFRKTGLLEIIGEENVFQSKTAGLAAVFQRLDKGVCADCTKRIFWECRTEYDPARVPLPTPIHPPMPSISEKIAESAKSTIVVKKPAKRQTPRRIIALVDLGNYPRGTVEMAVRLAREYESELALGSVVGWNVEHNADLSMSLLSESLLTSLRGPTESRLQGLAKNAGYFDCQILVSTKQGPREAILEMVTDWHPDLLVFSRDGFYDTGLSSQVTYRTPSGVNEVSIRRFRPSRRHLVTGDND